MDSLSIRALACALGCSVRTVHRHMAKGMPYLQAGKGCQLRFNLDDVGTWLRKQRVKDALAGLDTEGERDD